MARMLSEQTVKKRLGITSFRELTKDKIINLASMIDKMDPEVTKKALEQFPQFAETSKEILQGYEDTMNTMLDQNKSSMNRYYDICDSIIASLKQELEKEDLTFEDRKYIMCQMKEVADMVGEKDSENKRFLATMAALGGLVVTFTATYLGSTLGGKIRIDSGDDYDEIDDDSE